MSDKIDKGDSFLLVTGTCEDVEMLVNEEYLFSILKELPQKIGMKALLEPKITIAKNNPGLEGYIPIDMSNITISTYTNNHRIVACIHSCKDFKYDDILNYLKENFRCSKMNYLFCQESDFRCLA